MADANLVTLVFPPGEWGWTYPVSHGDVSFWPYSVGTPGAFDEWYIDVPRDVVAPLIAKGGFRVAQSARQAAAFHTAAMVRMVHPDGPKSFGWSPGPGVPGMRYAPNEDGVVKIPVEAVPVAQEAFGFVPAPPRTEEPPEALAPAPNDAPPQDEEAAKNPATIPTPYRPSPRR
jgi:hypothetical protein